VRECLDLSNGIFRRVCEHRICISGSEHPRGPLATIRRVWEDYGVMVGPHTADGVRWARAPRRAERSARLHGDR